jgi:hypothetical protein
LIEIEKKQTIRMDNNEDVDSSDDEQHDFSWSEYLHKTNSEAAPDSYFCQHFQPPRNEFRVGQKLETPDPRNISSTCIASVIEIAGPRLRLRLDGTDDRNDFWLMCDSDQIHPFGYSIRLGRKIQPPLGYGNELSKWPKFLDKLIQTAGDKGLFAAESCFKPPPSKPQRNEFKVGKKLEAVDPKNPHLICPATIREINRDKLFISFDGWSQSSQFWVQFTSRDLFPCGWCKKAGHDLQEPGTLEDRQAVPRRVSTSNIISSQNLYLSENPTLTDNYPKPFIKNQNKLATNRAVKRPRKSSKNKTDVTKQASDTSSDSTNLNITIDNTTLNQTQENNNAIDLSIVKQEAFEHEDYENNSIYMQNSKSQVLNGSRLNETTNIVKSNKHLNQNLTQNKFKTNGWCFLKIIFI